MTAGFMYDGFSLNAMVSHDTARQYTLSHSSTFSTSQMETYVTTLPAGVVWQFQVEVQDNCGTSTVQMRDFQVTDSAANPPCCLPGYFSDENDPRGNCTVVDGEVYNVCWDQDPGEEKDAIIV